MLIVIQVLFSKFNLWRLVPLLDMIDGFGNYLPDEGGTRERAWTTFSSTIAKYAVNALFRALTLLVLVVLSSAAMKAQDKGIQMEQNISYRTVKVDGLSIFYREAGPLTLPQSSCCTVFRRRRGCFSRC